MSIELHILGSGSATPIPGRNPTAQLLKLDQLDVLIDCGEGTQIQMIRFKQKPSRIKIILISHLHGDHYLGLPGLLSSMHLMGRREAIHIYGPPPLQEILEFQFKVSETVLRFPLHFHPTQDKEFAHLTEILGFDIFSFPLSHRIPTTGFLVKEKPRRGHLITDLLKQYEVPIEKYKDIKAGADFVTLDGNIIPNQVLVKASTPSISYAYCSDTAPTKEILNTIRNVDWLYHEATFLHELLDRATETFHSTAKQAGEIARDAVVKNLIIGHFSSRYRDVRPLKLEAEMAFKNVTAAEDGMKFIFR
jgi:ribonuclease Z